MAAENHPLFPSWSSAFEHLVESERRYHIAKMEGRPEGETEQAARELDKAREEYRAITDQIEDYSGEGG